VKHLFSSKFNIKNRFDLTEAPKQQGDYPVSESFEVEEGYDIYRSTKLIVALVVDSDFGEDVRMYRGQKRNDGKWTSAG
jgi:hypothetical protein